MIRESKEEIWINILKSDLKYLWVLHFYFDKNKEWNQDVYIYNILDFTWDIIETDEIKPLWFDIDNIPYDKMWKDDIYWLPRVLNWEKDIEYNFWFDKDNWNILNKELLK